MLGKLGDAPHPLFWIFEHFEHLILKIPLEDDFLREDYG